MMAEKTDFPAPTEFQRRAQELCDCETYCQQPYSEETWHNTWSGCRAKRIHDALIYAAEESDRTWAYVAHQLMRAANGTEYDHEAAVHNEALVNLVLEMERDNTGLPTTIVQAARRLGLWNSERDDG